MLKRFRYSQLDEKALFDLTDRSLNDDESVRESCEKIKARVQKDLNGALRQCTEQFDGVVIDELEVSQAEISRAEKLISPDLKEAILLAYENIRRFHELEKPVRIETETTPGVRVWREFRPLDRAGLYIPGGSAPLFSTALMLGIPANIAGCKETILCTPPRKDGSIAPEILFTAKILDIQKIFRVGGAQAIFAMAYGTESIPKVDKIFGPGNRYVTTAKQMVQNTVAIDMPAGPSEVLVIADASANPAFIAADLLSQAEHGADSQAVLVTDSEEIIALTEAELAKQLDILPRKEIARKALDNSYIIQTDNLDQGIDFSNLYAPEHLILHLEDWESVVPKITNAGSVFCGAYSPESAGDFASGTNHVLPTSGFARNHSGVSVESFGKFVTFQHLTRDGLGKIGPSVEIMADAEGLTAHQRAVSVRNNTFMDQDEIMQRFGPRMSPDNTGKPDLNKQKIYIPDHPQKVLDLHGFHVHEGVFEAENFLKRSRKNGLTKVRIITGHGSETGISLLFSNVGKRLRELQAGYENIKVEHNKGYFDIILLP